MKLFAAGEANDSANYDLRDSFWWIGITQWCLLGPDSSCFVLPFKVDEVGRSKKANTISDISTYFIKIITICCLSEHIFTYKWTLLRCGLKLLLFLKKLSRIKDCGDWLFYVEQSTGHHLKFVVTWIAMVPLVHSMKPNLSMMSVLFGFRKQGPETIICFANCSLC